MSSYPGAAYMPIGVSPGYGSNGPFQDTPLGLVLHCNAAESQSLYAYTKSHRADGPTCHFQIIKGDRPEIARTEEYIDLETTSWCQSAGNDTYWSVESQGLATDPMTPGQVQELAHLCAYLHTAKGMPLELANEAGERGLGFHGMGALSHPPQDWGHTVCPGVRKDQRAEVLAIAQSIVDGAQPDEDDDMKASELVDQPGGGKLTYQSAIGATEYYTQRGVVEAQTTNTKLDAVIAALKANTAAVNALAKAQAS